MRNHHHTTQSLRPAALALCAGGLLGMLGACASKEPTPEPTKPISMARLAPKPYDAGGREVSAMIGLPQSSSAGDRLVSREAIGANQGKLGVGASGGEIPEPGALVRVKYAAENVDARDVIRVLVRDYLGLDSILHVPQGGAVPKLTLDIDQEMSTGDIRDLLTGLALLYGWTIEESPELVLIRMPGSNDKSAIKSPTTPILKDPVLLGSANPVIRVRRLSSINPSLVNEMLTQLMGPGAFVASVGRTLVFADSAAQTKRIDELLSALDRPAFEGVEILTYDLKHRDAASALAILNPLVNATKLGGTADDPVISLNAIGKSNRLLVISRDPAAAGALNTLIEQIDQPLGGASRHRWIYRIQHYTPGELRTLVDAFFKDRITTDNSTTEESKMSLTWDTANGILLVSATHDDYAQLYATLKELDRAPQQVVLNCVIAEVGLNDRFEYGVENFLEGFDIEGFGSLELTANPGLPSASTGSVFFVGADGLSLIQALDTEGDVDILSQPYITAIEGTLARNQVGGRVPVVRADQGSNTQTGGDTDIRRNIEYEKTGVILEVTPQITESGDVRIKLKLEITDVGAEGELGPEFTTRIVDTAVVVPHGKTIVLGGIIQTDKRKTVRKTPILGDIPGVGLAFQNLTDEESRTELLLTITPTIINDPGRANESVSDFLRASGMVRKILADYEYQLPQAILNGVEMPMPTDLDSRDAHALPADADVDVDVEVEVAPAAEQAEPVADPEPVVAPEREASSPPPLPPMIRELLRAAGKPVPGEDNGEAGETDGEPKR